MQNQEMNEKRTENKKKKKTSHNYTACEKAMFLEILKGYASIIENKTTDSTSWKCKNETWKKITATYNSRINITQEVIRL